MHAIHGAPAEPDTGIPQGREHIADLVRSAQNRDSDAFAQLYTLYKPRVLGYVRHLVSTSTLAEDLTSETFTRALRAIATFSWRGRDFGAWLFTIARNIVFDHFKSSRTRREFSTGQMWDADPAVPSAEDIALGWLTDENLLAAVHRLNPDQRECITLRFLRDLTVAQTAAAMGRGEGAIKTLQYRAVRSLGRLLDGATPVAA